MPAFHSIEELLKTLSREQRLLKELFAKRKILSFRYEDALALVDYKEERIRKLVDSEVVRGERFVSRTGRFLSAILRTDTGGERGDQYFVRP